MQNQVLAITFTLIFLSLEAIWLITIRNRYIILVSLVTILFGVQVLSFLIIRDHYVMGNGYFLERLAKLLLKDGLLMLVIWVFFFTPFSFKRVKEMLSPIKIDNPINILTGVDQIFSEVKPITKAALVMIPCVIALVISPLGLLFSIIPLFWPWLIKLIFVFPGSLSDSPIQRFLPSILLGNEKAAVVSGWLLYASLATSIILTKRSFWLVLYFLFIFLLMNNVAGCQESVNVSW